MKSLFLSAYLFVVPFAWDLIGQVLPAAPSITDAKGLLDHAAAQNDRWLFILVLFILVGGLVWDKSESKKVMRTMFDEMRADRKESDKVIDKNTEALIRVEDALNRRA